jgi:hypothetical protein
MGGTHGRPDMKTQESGIKKLLFNYFCRNILATWPPASELIIWNPMQV